MHAARLVQGQRVATRLPVPHGAVALPSWCAVPAAAAASAAHPDGSAARAFHTAQTSKGALHGWAWAREQPALRCFLSEPLHALSCSPDGALCAGGTPTGALLLWQTATGKLLRTWHAHHKAVAALAFAPDGSWLVSGGEDTTVCVWSLAGEHARARGRPRVAVSAPHRDHATPTSAALTASRPFSAAELARGLLEGAAAAAVQPTAAHTWTAHTLPVSGVAVGVGAGTPLVASASLDRTAKVWSLCGGELLRTLLFPSALTALALDAADWTLFAGALNGRIYAAPLCGEAAPPEGGGAGAYELVGHVRPVRALAACADGHRLVSGSDDGTIKARARACGGALASSRSQEAAWFVHSIAGVVARQPAGAAHGSARQGRARDRPAACAQGALAWRRFRRAHALAAYERRCCTLSPHLQSALAPLRAVSAAGAPRARTLPLAPFAKYASDALPPGAKPWDGPPVVLCGGAPGPADEELWVRHVAARRELRPATLLTLRARTGRARAHTACRRRRRRWRAACARRCSAAGGAAHATRHGARGCRAMARAARRAARACSRPAVSE